MPSSGVISDAENGHYISTIPSLLISQSGVAPKKKSFESINNP